MSISKSISEDQKLICLNVMEKLQERAISQLFAFPIDPERDNCPDYFEKISHPMDLSTVNSKLKNNEYKKVSEWKKDVELIWNNSLLYHSNDIMMKTITKEMQDTFNSLAKFVTGNQTHDWNSKLIFLRDKFIQETKSFENFTNESRIMLKKKLESQKQGQTSQKGRKKSKKVLNRSGIIKLAKDINSLVKDDDLVAVLHIIEEEEPDVKVEGEYLVLNLTELRNSTLNLLRNKVDSLLPNEPKEEVKIKAETAPSENITTTAAAVHENSQKQQES